MSTRLEPTTFLRKASDIASFYGFRPAQTLQSVMPKGERFSVADTRDFDRVAQVCITCLSEKAPVVVVPPGTPVPPVYAKDAMLHFTVNPAPAEAPGGLAPRDVAEFGISIVGSPGSIGEIVALKTMFAIMNDVGLKMRAVRLGSAGDRDSKARFSRELGNYFKKRGADLSECCKESSATDPLSMFHCQSEDCRQLLREGPRAMNYLSEKSRAHFREVLEYLERMDMPYELDDRLVYDDKQPHVLFAIDLENENSLISAVRGGRYDDHVRRITGKKEATAVRASIFFRKQGASRSDLACELKERQAKVYFIKLGLEATLKGLTVVDALRKAKIPVYQSFSGDKLAPQLNEAERLKVPYLIIMGQREAMQDAVIVRRVETRSQNIVPIVDLPQFLRTV
jgi:histidyl-tRNA synthetase